MQNTTSFLSNADEEPAFNIQYADLEDPCNNESIYESHHSPLQLERMKRVISRPPTLIGNVKAKIGSVVEPETDQKQLKSIFSNLYGLPVVDLIPDQSTIIAKPLTVGVVLSGGQAAGGHNVVAGIFDYIKGVSPESRLIGFLKGPHGIFSFDYMEITAEYLEEFRNQGGFHIIQSGRHKIETDEQFANSLKCAQQLKLDGLVVVGGDDSNTNAALLAEYFMKNNAKINVVGVPKTIDGDLKNKYIEISFGFDTACRVFSECIGNICMDANSSRNTYHFVRLMGRSASHITLECYLQTRTTLALIGEEVAAKKMRLSDITSQVCDIICKRADFDKNFGVILVPEGLIEFVPEMKVLISELNDLLAIEAHAMLNEKQISEKLSPTSAKTFNFLPQVIRQQLLIDRDAHGNVQVSKIDTERLLILLCETELKTRKNYSGKFRHRSHFFGYEGRAGLPSRLDANYCYALGLSAAALVRLNFCGYMATVRNLIKPIDKWTVHGVPLVSMMNIEHKKGKDKPVIKKALVELDQPLFKNFAMIRDSVAMADCFCNPGPIQFYGPASFIRNFTLAGFSPDEFKIDEEVKCDTFVPKKLEYLSTLQQARIGETLLEFPHCLDSKSHAVYFGERVPANRDTHPSLITHFPSSLSNSDDYTFGQRLIQIVPSNDLPANGKAINVGIVFCGRQNPTGNSIIEGILRFLKKDNPKSRLIGFLGGVSGLLSCKDMLITEDTIKLFKNQGGYDLLGVSSEDINSPELVAVACSKLNLQGLIFVGSNKTITGAALISEYFLVNRIVTSIIVVPATMDCGIKHKLIETTLGFDTVSKVYSHLIGNIVIDAVSAAKYWYFVRLMGDKSSHLVLECALQTHPNIVLIGEEESLNGTTLQQLVSRICDDIALRSHDGKDYGIIIIPEGLLSNLPQFKQLFDSLNEIFSKETKSSNPTSIEVESEIDSICSLLPPADKALLRSLPIAFQTQILFHRDTRSKIQLSQIETERLLAELVKAELAARTVAKTYSGKFAATTHFLGYQGRSSIPSVFDCNLGIASGFAAGVFIRNSIASVCVSLKGLVKPVCDWEVIGVPLLSMLSVVNGAPPTVKLSGVDIDGMPFYRLKSYRPVWLKDDFFVNPGPIQYWGPLANQIPISLVEAQMTRATLLCEIDDLCQQIQKKTMLVSDEDSLKFLIIQLRAMINALNILQTK